MEESSNDHGEGFGGEETEDASALKVWHKKHRHSKPYTLHVPKVKVQLLTDMQTLQQTRSFQAQLPYTP